MLGRSTVVGPVNLLHRLPVRAELASLDVAAIAAISPTDLCVRFHGRWRMFSVRPARQGRRLSIGSGRDVGWSAAGLRRRCWFWFTSGPVTSATTGVVRAVRHEGGQALCCSGGPLCGHAHANAGDGRSGYLANNRHGDGAATATERGNEANRHQVGAGGNHADALPSLEGAIPAVSKLEVLCTRKDRLKDSRGGTQGSTDEVLG